MLYWCVEKYDSFSELWLLIVALSSATPALSLNVSHFCHRNTSSNPFQSQERPCLLPRCQHNKFLVNVKHNFIVKDVIIHNSMPSYRKIVGKVRQSHSGLYVIVSTWNLTEGKERLVFFILLRSSDEQECWDQSSANNQLTWLQSQYYKR